jgi:hypothetical protein
MASPGTWTDVALEERVLADIAIDEPWALLERFSTLTRLSGSDEEAQSVDYITGRLDAFGVAYAVHHPVCLISWPGRATLRTTGPGGTSYAVKTPSLSPHTGGQEVTGQLAYVPGGRPADMAQLFAERRAPAVTVDLRGKVLITEGMGMSARGVDLQQSGVIAAIFVNPGSRIHEGITTNSWGSPDLDSLGRTPPVPILTINREDGAALIELVQQGPVEVAFSNQVDAGWRPIPVIVAEIPGSQTPEEFVLFHGHLDSWHVGIGDNATGDATLLEIARVFQQHRASLARSLRIAWWSGHSHGRYAGSAWYTDAFALDLMEHCVSHVNCDSPGCRWATVYDNVMAMPEAGELVQQTIRDVTSQGSTLLRPLRAGDNSFNNLGITLYFMLSSTMPEELRREKGYYGVGGCGGNIAWHTEDDTMEIADRDNLLRDARVYAAALLRTLNAPVYPFDYRAAVDDLRHHVTTYAEAAGAAFDFAPALAELDALRATLDRFYAYVEAHPPRDTRAGRAANAVQRLLSRELVSLNHSRDGRFRQDPARQIPPLPDLQPATRLAELEPGSEMANVIGVHLTRGQNRLIWACRTCAREVEWYLGE